MAVNRFAIRAHRELGPDLVRVVEQSMIEPWEALEEFVKDVKLEYPGWVRGKITITMELVS